MHLIVCVAMPVFFFFFFGGGGGGGVGVERIYNFDKTKFDPMDLS